MPSKLKVKILSFLKHREHDVSQNPRMSEMNSVESVKATDKEFVVLIASLMSIVAISIDALLPALSLITTDLAVSNPNHTQFVIGCFFIGMAIGQLISGPCSDAVGRKRVLYYGIAIYLVGSLVCYLSQSLEMLLFGRIIQGLGVSAPYVTAISIVRDKYTGSAMARIMSLVMMIFILIPAIAPTLGQAILYIASWREVFFLYVLYSIAITTWIYFRLEETLLPQNRIKLDPAHFKHGFLEVVKNKITRNYTICMGLFFGSFIGYLNSSQQIFQVQFAVGKLFIVYFGALALVFGASSLTNSHFVEKIGMYKLCLIPTVSIFIISLVFLLLSAVTKIDLWMFLIYAAVLFFSFGLMFGNLNAIAMEPMGHIAGMAAAITGASSSIISMTIGSIIGQLYDNTLLPITLGFMLASALAAIIIFYTRPQSEALV